MKFKYAISILVLSATVTACSSDGLSDLRTFTKNTHKDRKPRVDPIPEVKVFEKYAYTAYKLPDPFSRENLRNTGVSAKVNDGEGLQPDLTRPKEALEEYPLDALTMVGTLERRNVIWGVIQVASADGEMHRVKVGNHMGRNFGMVTEITDDKIVLVELVRSSLGDWIEREAAIKLRE
ncbi:MAG: pilus assembly protein PilP [Acidiferrobacterales bacterium]